LRDAPRATGAFLRERIIANPYLKSGFSRL